MPDNLGEEIRVLATTEYLRDVRAFLQLRLREVNYTDVELQGILLAVDEACANLIQHAYRGEDTQYISVLVNVSPEAVTIRVYDTAPPFDPANVHLPDMRVYFSEHRRGGLGILIMHHVMDDITYVPGSGPKNSNVLTLTKYRHS